ncbi:MAG TPA: amidohydrolase family protein [Bacteroidota bacterium]|nr:amidohydrolase family protein [Bacteroidota bacterium]
MRWLSLFLSLTLSVVIALGQTAPPVGLRDNTPSVHAFTNARIVVAPGKIISKGTVVIRNGVIEAVGENITPPADARVWDLSGRTLYPGLIELASDYGQPKPPQPQQQSGGFDPFQAPPRPDPVKGPAHWNPKVRADYAAHAEFQPDSRAAEKLRSQGFTLTLSTPQRGLFRGTSALVSLGEGQGADLVVKPNVAHHVTFEQTPGFFGGYPNSLMGAIAMIRQTWLDADWYRRAQETYTRYPDRNKRPETNAPLEALQAAVQGRQPVVMEAADDINFLRAAKIQKEFNLHMWILGSGYEYRRLDAIKATRIPVIVPLNFPEAPTVETPEEALNITLEDLRHWDAAPENAGRLSKAGVPFALTSAQLKDQTTFLAQVRKAIERGLSTDAALAAVTTVPAQWLGLENRYGTIEKGKAANLVITDGDLFAEKTKLQEVWIDGKRYEVKPPPSNDARGTWDVTVSADPEQKITLALKGEADKPSGTLNWRGKELRLGSVSFSAGRLAFTATTDSIDWKGVTTFSGVVTEKEIQGVGTKPDGAGFTWQATRREPAKAEPDTAKPKEPTMASFPEVYPPGEYGRPKQPDQPAHVLVKNATIWTQGPQGKLDGADLLVAKGKIVRVGKNLTAPAGAVVIDATGKHVTPGLIDAHSHTALSSVNEGGQAITSETRTEDVIEPDDIWIYRQLAGGTTAANQLHGSANPIGGQNSVVKWRWGGLAEDLLLQGAPPGIKFALGENVKQSNFLPGGRPSGRYPQTRMGVEQIIRDEFKTALDYERAWKEWEKDKTKIPPRKDLQSEAALEILKGKRLVHAHSYRQDEILMLIRVADDFGFKIASFQHVLEGYKVADAIAKHGAGASSFSDWWAYKIEAWDAIPGNGPLMHRQGVVVSYNSDNSQLATRLNWEAAKAVEFGVSEEEALNFVTLNPAKQLHVQNRIGSLEPGKDADFVIWSGHPLSTFSKCEQTWVDGRKYFDLAEDRQMREQIQKERATIVQKILAAKKDTPAGPSAGQRPPMRRPNEVTPYSCMEGVSHEE